MTIKPKFNFFDTVYLKSDTDQKPRTVRTIQCIPGGVILYELENANTISWHYEGSISTEKIEFNKPAGFVKDKALDKTFR